MKLHWQILIALILAVLAGLASGVEASLFGLRFYDAYVFIGTLFLNALKMVIVPLVVSSIIVGIAGIGSSGAFGRLGGRTLTYYLATTFISVSIGLLVVNSIEPGIHEAGKRPQVQIQRGERNDRSECSRIVTDAVGQRPPVGTADRPIADPHAPADAEECPDIAP